jgi:hypothetical protein
MSSSAMPSRVSRSMSCEASAIFCSAPAGSVRPGRWDQLIALDRERTRA